MRQRAAARDRFLRDPLPLRLGGIAANLARVESFSTHPDHQDVVERLVEESKLMVEWMAPEVDLELQIRLVALQRELAGWGPTWSGMWSDPSARARTARRAGQLSRHALALSGLLPKGPAPISRA